MKSTGMIRRIDDLGRVVIPKEIRRKLNLKEGDPLEIFTTNIEGEQYICLNKYCPNYGENVYSNLICRLENIFRELSSNFDGSEKKVSDLISFLEENKTKFNF